MRPTAPPQRQRLWVLLTLFVALAVAVVGCTQTVSGHGTASNPPSSSAPSSGSGTSSSKPSTSSSASTPNDVACPVIVDSLAKLSYPCIVNTMTRLTDQAGIWLTQVGLQVEPTWYMNEGSRGLTETSGVSLTTINGTIMSAMKANQFWGPNAKATTKASKAMTIDGHQARLLQTLMTVSPTYRQRNHLKVKSEMVWVVAIRVTDATAAAFFCSVPDEVKKYWPLVPRIITQLRRFQS